MKIIGHRGARGLAPENTIASLKKALEHHADMLEFDLRVTKDGVVVLHHNARLVDPDGHKHRIADYTYKQLKEHKPDLVTFEEMLRQIDHPVPLYVEAKRREPTKPIIKIITAHLAKGWPPDAFYLSSKSQKILMELHAALPQVPTIVIEPWSGVRARFRARQVGAKIVSMKQRWLWWGFIRGFKHSDYQLYAYTLNDVAKAKRWERWGLAGVVTDYPDRFEKK
jgi:glycerophosphoryl diester phosphodiesterase